MARIVQEKEEAPYSMPTPLVRLAPLKIAVREVAGNAMRTKNLDALIEADWDGRPYRFGALYKRLTTPKIFRAALDEIGREAKKEGLYPMLVVPYLSNERLDELEQSAISGIDLCGNGIVFVPNKIFVSRSGSPNRFTTSAPIKNIYRKSSSLAARVFLVRPEYASVNALNDEIQRRGGEVSLATVSRALKALEEDLIVDRLERSIRLVQPEKLLQRLVKNFERPEVKRTYATKISLPRETLLSTLAEVAEREQVRIAISGEGSVGQYAVMVQQDVLPVYCTSYEKLIANLPVSPESFFPNVELRETEEETAYFDVRPQNGIPWASPLQTYLELSVGEKRDRETAEQVRLVLMRELQEVQNQ